MLQYSQMNEESSIEAELASLPKGTIVRRTIRGTDRFYHQWREDGVTKSRYLSPGEIMPLRARLDRRKYLLSLRLGPAATSAGSPNGPCAPSTPAFRCDVLTGHLLSEYAASVNIAEKRDCYFTLFNYARQSPGAAPALFLTGPRGTGKTTLLRQFVRDLSPTHRAKAAYLRLTGAETPADVTSDLTLLRDLGFRLVLIDEAHRLAGLPGTGLGMILAGESVPAALDGLVASVNIAFIPFREFAHLTGATDPAALVERGGTLGTAPLPQGTAPATDNANMRKNDRFVLDVLALAAIRAKDAARTHGEAFLGTDLQKLRNRFAELSGLSDAEDDTSREALLEEPPHRRYAQACARLAQLQEDPILDRLGAAERKLIRDILRAELRFRLLEDIVWDELRHAAQVGPGRAGPIRTGTTKVHRVSFTAGSYGFVIADEEELTCEIVVVTTDAVRDPAHVRYLDDPARLDVLEHRYGTITNREVLYSGRDARLASGVAYRNLAKYLTRLG